MKKSAKKAPKAPAEAIRKETEVLSLGPDSVGCAAEPPRAPQLFHEENSKRQHRIVIVTSKGADCSAWFEDHEIAQYKGYFAVTSGNAPLQRGVFRQEMLLWSPIFPQRYEQPVEVVRRDTERSD